MTSEIHAQRFNTGVRTILTFYVPCTTSILWLLWRQYYVGQFDNNLQRLPSQIHRLLDLIQTTIIVRLAVRPSLGPIFVEVFVNELLVVIDLLQLRIWWFLEVIFRAALRCPCVELGIHELLPLCVVALAVLGLQSFVLRQVAFPILTFWIGLALALHEQKVFQR